MINEFISIEKARDTYKVILGPERLEIDWEETNRARGAKEAAKKAAAKTA